MLLLLGMFRKFDIQKIIISCWEECLTAVLTLHTKRDDAILAKIPYNKN